MAIQRSVWRLFWFRPSRLSLLYIGARGGGGRKSWRSRVIPSAALNMWQGRLCDDLRAFKHVQLWFSSTLSSRVTLLDSLLMMDVWSKLLSPHVGLMKRQLLHRPVYHSSRPILSLIGLHNESPAAFPLCQHKQLMRPTLKTLPFTKQRWTQTNPK